MSTAARIPPFDPIVSRGLFYRALTAFLRTRAGLWFAMHVAAGADPVLLKLTGGRLGMGLTLPTAALTTTGARSGVPRTIAVLYFTDADDVILIASNFGQDHHPAWYHNLRAHPEATLSRGGITAPYRATEVTDPSVQARLFAHAVAIYPGYEDYRVRTAAAGRLIPILRLEPQA